MTNHESVTQPDIITVTRRHSDVIDKPFKVINRSEKHCYKFMSNN
jgi:hypothetical protein